MGLLEHGLPVLGLHPPGRDHQGDRVVAAGQPLQGGQAGRRGALGLDPVVGPEPPLQVALEGVQHRPVVGDEEEDRFGA